MMLITLSRGDFDSFATGSSQAIDTTCIFELFFVIGFSLFVSKEQSPTKRHNGL